MKREKGNSSLGKKPTFYLTTLEGTYEQPNQKSNSTTQ
jgi:hypothetical protein